MCVRELHQGQSPNTCSAGHQLGTLARACHLHSASQHSMSLHSFTLCSTLCVASNTTCKLSLNPWRIHSASLWTGEFISNKSLGDYSIKEWSPVKYRIRVSPEERCSNLMANPTSWPTLHFRSSATRLATDTAACGSSVLSQLRPWLIPSIQVAETEDKRRVRSSTTRRGCVIAMPPSSAKPASRSI